MDRTRTVVSGSLACSALLAAVLPLATIGGDAAADPDIIDIQAFQVGPASDPAYVYTYIGGFFQFGIPTAFEHDSYGFVLVNSGPSTRPGWEYEMVMDWSNFNLPLYASGGPEGATADFIDLFLDIKDDATDNPISAVQVKNAQGVIGFQDLGSSPGSLDLRVSVFDILIDGQGGIPDLLIVQWNQSPVPAPAAFALLGVAACAGSRRRTLA